MRTRLKTLFLAAVAVVLATSCSMGRRQPIVDVTVQNNTTNQLGWAEVNWGEGSSISVGVFAPHTGKTYYDTSFPKSVKTNIATIEFVDEEDARLHIGSEDERLALRKQSIRRVPVDVSPLRRLAPGHYHVTVSLLSLTNAELVIQTKPKKR